MWSFNRILWLSLAPLVKCYITLRSKITIRDGGSPPPYAAYIVDTVFTVDTVYTVETVDMVYTVDMAYTVDIVYTVDMVYTVYTVDNAYIVCTIETTLHC